MNSEPPANSPPPDDAPKTRPIEWRPVLYSCENDLGPLTTYTYLIEERPALFTFAHDMAKGVFVVSNHDGTTERFRDNPARQLLVERDPETGELRPAVKHGRPVYIYLCREQREP
jgi:hypothetical protein